MDKVALLPQNQRAELFSETGMKKGIGPAIIEKDFWVCWVLEKLFNSKIIGDKILFKGGTSLSKVFKVIERFSEDIDLILNWNELTIDNPQDERSNTKQSKFNQILEVKSHSYIQETILPEIENLIGSNCNAAISAESADVININYPAAFTEEYLRPTIQLEIGPLALWCPNAQYEISSYAAEEFPQVFSSPSCKVNAIKAERTFWEKATILHHEANRPTNSVIPQRYSRHYYDLARMAESQISISALSQFELLTSVAEFKNKFYPRTWARYDLAKPGTLKLLPSQDRITELEKDYKEMQVMFFGDIPYFDTVIESLRLLEHKINS